MSVAGTTTTTKAIKNFTSAVKPKLSKVRRTVERPPRPQPLRRPAAPAVNDGLHPKQRKIIDYRRHQEAIIKLFTPLGSTQTRANTWQPYHSLHRPPSPSELTLSALVAAGAHMGHTRALTRAPFLPYTYGHRAGINIIDLDQTLPLLRRAANVTRAVAEADGVVLFVGTNDTLKPTVRKAAERMGPNGFHIDTRWLPGLLTNPFEVFGEQTVKTTNVKPDLVVFLNPLQNLKALRECAIALIPTIGIIDSNADPRLVLYPIPANDESTRTAELIAGALSIAGREGVERRLKKQKAMEEAYSKNSASGTGGRGQALIS